MNIKGVEHIGIAVKSLNNSIPIYEEMFGLKCTKIEEVTEQKVKTAFFYVGEIKIELLEPTSNDSPIAKFIEKKGEGLHHIAFCVNNINNALKTLLEKNINLIDKIPRKGAEGLDIAFIHPKETLGVLIELCENPNRN